MTGVTPTTSLSDDALSAHVLSSERVFAGKVWDIRQDIVQYGESEIIREYVDHTGAVAILALDNDGRVLLIKQYRHPIGARDWEIPAGLLDIHGEGPLVAAQRELAEEVDLVAAEWHVLSDFTTSPGGSNEVVRVYLARGLTPTAVPFNRTAEEVDIEKRWVDLDEVIDAILMRSIANSILAIAALTAQAARTRGWETLAAANTPWPRGRD